MTGFEIRLRCIEAVAGTGVREPARLINDAKTLEEFVLAAPVAPAGQVGKPAPKTAGKSAA